MRNDISRRRLKFTTSAAIMIWRDVVAAWYSETPRPARRYVLSRFRTNVGGRIRGQTGKPIKGARVKIWQTNAYGRYSDPRHENTNLNLEPNFLGFGHFLTGEDGAYRFRSIKPTPYPNSAA